MILLSNKSPLESEMNAPAEISPILKSVKTLLTEIVDYAGLFPPAQLSMRQAVENYNKYRHGDHRWILGRFITPVSRLDEFIEYARDLSSGDVWRLSVLAGEDAARDFRQISDFNSENRGSFECDVVELKADSAAAISQAAEWLPAGIAAYFEIDTGEHFAALVSELAVRRVRAKIRTGGTRCEDFPSSSEIIRFVRTCQAANVPYKATAGLHHPIRCYRPLTYEDAAPQGTMHGFLNMLIMNAFARERFRPTVLEQLMEEEFDEAFSFSDAGVSWREYFLGIGQLERVRGHGMISFGSCSFDEPVADLQSMGLL